MRGKEQQCGQNRRGAGADDEDGERAHRRRTAVRAGLLFAVEFLHRFLQPARRLQGINVKQRQRQPGKEQRHQHGNPRLLQNHLQVNLENAKDRAEQRHRRAHRQHIDADETVSAGGAGVFADHQTGDNRHQWVNAGGETDADAEQQDEWQRDEEMVVQLLHDGGRFITAGDNWRRGGCFRSNGRRGGETARAVARLKMELPLNGRVANQPLGAALQMQGQRLALHVGQAEAQGVAVNLLLAEKIVLMPLALWQRQRQRLAVQLRLQTMAVEVIAFRHLVMQVKLAVRAFLRIDEKRLVFRQDLVFLRLEQRRLRGRGNVGGFNICRRRPLRHDRLIGGDLGRRHLQRPRRRRITNNVFLAALRLQRKRVSAVAVAEGNRRRLMPHLRRPQIRVLLRLCRGARLLANHPAERSLDGIQIIAVGKMDGDFGAIAVGGRALMDFRLEYLLGRQRIGLRDSGSEKPKERKQIFHDA